MTKPHQMADFWNTFTTWLQTQDYLSFETLAKTTPPPIWKFMEVYIGFLVLCLVGGIVTLFLNKLHPTIKDRLLNLFWTNAILGAILFFFRYYEVPLLGMDLWRTLQLLGFALWTGLIIDYILNGHKHVRLHEQVIDYKNKYLPKGNRK